MPNTESEDGEAAADSHKNSVKVEPLHTVCVDCYPYGNAALQFLFLDMHS